jgi:lipoprotein-releasing system permease protein
MKISFPFFMSRRYLFAKKSHTAINFISIISVVGVAMGTMAFIVVLSVYNGFDDLIKSLFNSFDPDIKISLVEGKTFIPDSIQYQKIKHIQGVRDIAEVVEENAMLQYGKKEYIATIKGVSDNFNNVNSVNTRISDGKFMLNNGSTPFAVIGLGVSYYLAVNINYGEPLVIYVPRRGAEISLIPEEAFNRKYINISGIFSIAEDIDSKYVLVPITFARSMLEYKNEVTALEVKLQADAHVDEVQDDILKILGPSYRVQNRYQQQELFYKIMKSEKWAIFFILSFILIVASLNIIGSLTMLILDKKKDIKTLNHLGADWKIIRKIFLYNGWFNTFIGAIIGTSLGLFICWLQIHYGFVKLQGSGSFVIDSYPVKIVTTDILIVLCTVFCIGFVTSLIPVRVISRKYFE